MGELKDGSTRVSAEEKERTSSLPDGSSSAASEASEGADTASGGPADDRGHASAYAQLPDPIKPVRAFEVDPRTGTGPDGMPVENPSG